MHPRRVAERPAPPQRRRGTRQHLLAGEIIEGAGASLPSSSRRENSPDWSAAHARQPVEGLAATVRQGASGLPHRHHRLVDLRHRAAVEPPAPPAGLAPARRRGKVRGSRGRAAASASRRARPAAAPGDVGLDQLDAALRAGQHAGPAQRVQQVSDACIGSSPRSSADGSPGRAQPGRSPPRLRLPIIRPPPSPDADHAATPSPPSPARSTAPPLQRHGGSLHCRRGTASTSPPGAM